MRKITVVITICALLLTTGLSIIPIGVVAPLPIQPPTGYDEWMVLQEPDLSRWDVDVTKTDIVAEDFLCTETGLIVGITLWGSWEGDEEGKIINFHLSMHNDIPEDNRTYPPINYSRPSNAIWEYNTGEINSTENGTQDQGWFSPSVPYWNPDDHDRWFRYDINIKAPLAFQQYEGNVYWLAVQATTDGDNFGWKVSNRQVRDDAVWGIWDESAGDDLDLVDWNELIDPITNESLDMCLGLINKENIPTIPITVNTDITLNLGSRGRWISAHFEMPVGYGPEDVDFNTLLQIHDPDVPDQGGGCFTLLVEWALPTGVKKVLTKFDRSELEDVLIPGLNDLVLSGQLKDGTELQGEFSVNAFNPKK